MLRNLNVTTGGRRILGVPTVGILAATIVSETASGSNGAGLLYDEASNPANSGKQLRIDITSIPGSGTLFVYENGAFDFDGAANGTYTVGYDWYADDVIGGSDTASIIVGAADGSATGATLTGTSTLTPGSAQGTAAGTAPGATLTGASSLTTGGATGGSGAVDGSASGVTLTGAGSLSAGSASGNQNASAPGATLTGSSSLVAGAAGAQTIQSSEVARRVVAAARIKKVTL